MTDDDALARFGLPAAPECRQAIRVCECEDAGDFEDWTPESWIVHYRRYFHIDP